MMDKPRELFVTCACYGEGVWLVNDAEDEQFYLSLWSSHVHTAGAQPWRQRLRHIWRILRTGVPYKDDVVLDHAAAHKIARWLSEELTTPSSDQSRRDGE